MQRSQVLARFTVNLQGEITTPGIWEGELLYAPFFYEAYRLGRRGELVPRNDDVLSIVFPVTIQDRAAFPELDDVVDVTLFVDGSRKLEFMHLEASRCRGGRQPNMPYEDDDEADDNVVEMEDVRGA